MALGPARHPVALGDLMKHFKIEAVVSDDYEDANAAEYLFDLITEGLNANGFTVQGEVGVYEVTHYG